MQILRFFAPPNKSGLVLLRVVVVVVVFAGLPFVAAVIAVVVGYFVLILQ